MALLEDLFSQGTIERLGWMLVHFLWQAAAVAALLAGLLRLLKRTTANLRYAVACAALALMVVLPLVTMQLVEVAGPVAEAGPPLESSLRATVEPPPAIIQTVDRLPPMSATPPLETADLTAPIPWRERLTTALEAALPYVVIGWLVGVLGLSAWHLGGWAQLHRLKRRMACEADGALRATLAELGVRLGIRRTVALLESALVEVPTVVGWLRPVILLPASALTGLSPDQLRAILAHELAHIRRYDYLANMLQTVVEILGFYHPAVWWVSHRIRVERENCCDDLAVRICGNSLQYARALTSMEEIRHGRIDLAVAATGGSLMARIARLLGRPAVDDRRFTWLPGLIALLLVVGIIVPAALVLGAPEPPLAAQHARAELNTAGQIQRVATKDAASTRARVESPPRNDTPDEDKAQVLVDFTVAKALTGATIDRETMLRIGEALAVEKPQAATEIANADPQQSVTLGNVLRKYVTGQAISQDTHQALFDLLRRRGYVQTLSNPKVITFDGQEARIQIGSEVPLPLADDDNDSAQTEPQAIQFIHTGIDIKATPHVAGQDRIMLEMAVTWTDLAPQPWSNNRPAVHMTEIASAVTVPNDRYFSLLAERDKSETPQAKDPESMLVMFKPKIVRPASAPADGLAPQASQKDSRQRQVRLEVRTVEVESGELASLGVEWRSPTLASGVFSGAGAPTRGMQIGYTPDQSFTDSLLAALDRLKEQNRARILSNQQVVAMEGRESRIKAVTQEWFPQTEQAGSPSARKYMTINSGTTLSVTPHIGDGNEITLRLAIENSKTLPTGKGSNLPIVTRRQTQNIVSIRNGGTVALAGLTFGPGDQDNRSTKEIAVFVTAYLTPETSPQRSHTPAPLPPEAGREIPSEMFKPKIVQPVSVPTDETAPQTSAEDHRLRQVLLDARVVTIERGNMLNLGMEWGFPTISRRSYDGAEIPTGFRIGHSADQVATNALIAKLDLLVALHQAKIAAHPQIVALDGHSAQIRSVDTEWSLLSDPQATNTAPGDQARSELQKIESGTVMTITPHIGDSNQITLKVAVEVSDSIPRGPDGDPPIITRRQTQNIVSIRNGGTVALAGLTFGPGDQDNRSTKEITVFVTAHLVPEISPQQSHTPAPLPLEAGREILSEQNRSESRAWTIMRQWNCPPLLLGLTQQFAKMLEPWRQNDPAWKGTHDGGTLRVKVDIEGEDTGEVLIGLFADARWSREPVAVRRVAGPGMHVLTGLPAGSYQIGVMMGEAPAPVALGVQRRWPEPVEIRRSQTTTAEVLVSEAFQKHASGWYNEAVAADYLGRWGSLDEGNLLQGRLTDPDGRPIPFGEIMIREHRTDSRGFAAPNRGTDERGLYKFDEMAWPYHVIARWREPLPFLFGHRYQTMSLGRVLEGPQQIDFRFDSFPQGTAKLAGRVLDQDGRPVEGFFIRLLTQSSDDLRREEPLDGKFHAYTGYDIPFLSQDGSFELSGLPAGAASAHVIPFEIKRYERRDFMDVILAAGQTARLDFQLTGRQVFYGRILFEDGSPAVVRPAPWKGAVTRILLTMGYRATVSAEVDSEGYFALYLDTTPGSNRLIINVPTDQERRWATAGEFPFEKLARTRKEAGVVTVTRPLPDSKNGA